MAILALGMSMYSIIYALTLFPSLKSLIFHMADKEKLDWNNKKKTEKFCIVILILFILVFFREIDGVIFFFAMMIFIQTLPMIWTIFKKSFTFGEGVIVLESGILYGAKFFVKKDIQFQNFRESDFTKKVALDNEEIYIIADHILVSLLTLCIFFHFFKKLKVPELFYPVGLASTCGFSYVFLWWKLR